MEPTLPALEVQSLNHWPREVPNNAIFMIVIFILIIAGKLRRRGKAHGELSEVEVDLFQAATEFRTIFENSENHFPIKDNLAGQPEHEVSKHMGSTGDTEWLRTHGVN